MGVVRLAFQSLKSDKLKSLFYFLSFVLTTIFIFLFFNLTLNPHTGINLGGRDETIVTPIAVFVIFIAMLCVFMANDFYVHAKSKDISIVLMSGASVYKVGAYLLLQSLAIMVVAIPVGLLLAYFLVPVVNHICYLAFDYQGNINYISQNSYLATAIILFCEIGWCTYLNMGYCYRTNVNTMITDSIKMENFGFEIKKPSNIVYLLAFIIPIFVFPFLSSVEDYLLLSLVGVFGLYGVIKHIVPEVLSRLQKDRGIENRYLLITFGNVKYDFQKIRMIVILVMMASIILMCSTLYTIMTPLVSMIVLLSYFSVMVLLSVTTIFKMGMELKNRQKAFTNLFYLGYRINELKKIINYEMIIFYGMIMIIPMVYQIIMVSRLYFLGLITPYLIIVMALIEIIPMLLCLIITTVMYYRILPKAI